MHAFKLLRARHLRVGASGERVARRLLRAKGMEILARNYKCAKGEIDIVAQDGGTLCFVEVKTRNYSPLKPGSRCWVTSVQAKRIMAAADEYLEDIGNPKALCRFDLVEIALGRFGAYEIYHWRGNFGKAGRF